jgi:microcystin-dependent protein
MYTLGPFSLSTTDTFNPAKSPSFNAQPITAVLIQNSSQFYLNVVAGGATDEFVAPFSPYLLKYSSPTTSPSNISVSAVGTTTDFFYVTVYQVGDQIPNVTVTNAPLFLGNGVDIGEVKLFAGVSPPSGWLLCDGTSYSTTAFASLFAIIGYVYGGAGGNFNVPDLRGKVPVGASGSFPLASTGGEQTHLLVTGEMPTHNHTDTGHGHSAGTESAQHTHANPTALAGAVGSAVTVFGGGGGLTNTGVESGAHSHTINAGAAAITNTGGGGAHNNMQPYLSLNYIIAAA